MTTPEPTPLREALEAIAAEHHADPNGGMGYRDGGYGHMDSVCVLCGTSDEYGIPWPCKTHEQARAALAAPPAALDVERLAQHFPFGTPIGLGCFCGWRSDPYRQLDWWEHVAAAYQQEGEK